MDDSADHPDFDEAFPGLFMAAYRVTYRMLGNVTQAEDAAAEAVARALVAWRRVGALDYREAWVARVAGNLAVDEIRRARPRGSRRWATDEAVPDTSEDATLRLALGAALSALSSRQRQVISLRYLADLDDAQVARVLGIIGQLGEEACGTRTGGASRPARPRPGGPPCPGLTEAPPRPTGPIKSCGRWCGPRRHASAGAGPSPARWWAWPASPPWWRERWPWPPTTPVTRRPCT